MAIRIFFPIDAVIGAMTVEETPKDVEVLIG
jgi:hypothetical protein